MGDVVPVDDEHEPMTSEPACGPPQGQGSVTRWIGAYGSGRTADARLVWDRYFTRMLGLARRIFGKAGLPRMVADEEDAAVGALASFCAGLRQGRFLDLKGRHELSRLLRQITKYKALKLGQHERREKRGGGRVLAEADLPGIDTEHGALDRVASPHHGPESALMHDEESRRLLELLEDETLRQIARWRLEGYTIKEIAQRIGRSQSLVRIKLAVIGRKWEGAAQMGVRPDEP
jgi:DNA-directed RNA polymerase specialized sigma24 family protein